MFLAFVLRWLVGKWKTPAAYRYQMAVKWLDPSALKVASAATYQPPRTHLRRNSLGPLRDLVWTLYCSRIDLSCARSLRLLRRIARAMTGLASFEKPAGSPRFRSVILVPPVGVSSQV